MTDCGGKHGPDSPSSRVCAPSSSWLGIKWSLFCSRYRSRDLQDATAVPVLSSVQRGFAQDPVCLHTGLRAVVPSAVDTLLIFCQIFY